MNFKALLVAGLVLCSPLPAQALVLVTYDSAGVYSFQVPTAGMYRISVGGAAGGRGGRGGAGGQGGDGGHGGGSSGTQGTAGRAGLAGGAGIAGALGQRGALIAGDFDLVAAQTLSIFVRGTGFGGFGGADGGNGADGWSGQNGQYAGGGGGGGFGGRSGQGGQGGNAAFQSLVQDLIGAQGGAGGSGGFGGRGGQGGEGGDGGASATSFGCFFACPGTRYNIFDGAGGSPNGDAGYYDRVQTGFNVAITGRGGGGGRGLDGALGSAGRPGAAAFGSSFNSGMNPFTGVNSLTTGFVTIEQLTQVGVVPEPATWAMMIAGFGLAGTALRRRRAVGDAGGRAATRP